MGFHTEKPFELEYVSPHDLMVATSIFGFTLGFMYFTALHAWRQTHKFHVFTVLIWAEVAVCLGFAVECILYLDHVIVHSFMFYFTILTMWALQVQLLLQIIINRICMLWSNPRHKLWLKWGVAAWITAINITVYCIWVPARLEITHRYVVVNNYWDRTEKILYAVTDAILNALFIRTVKTRLVDYGLKKYDRLVKFNVRIIGISLLMDVMIITMMSYPNSFVYMQFHPLAYIVKLNIELAMGDLIVQIARETSTQTMATTMKPNPTTADPLMVNVVTNTNVTFDQGSCAGAGNNGHITPPPNAAHRDMTGRMRPHDAARARVRQNPFLNPLLSARKHRRARETFDDDMVTFQCDEVGDVMKEKEDGGSINMSQLPILLDSIEMGATTPVSGTAERSEVIDIEKQIHFETSSTRSSR